MNANEYQKQASRTCLEVPPRVYTADEIMLVWNALGLAGECGEVAELVKKAVFHDVGIDRDKLLKELGDVSWYVAALASKLKAALGDDVLQPNIDKLKARYPGGFVAGGGIR